MSRLPIKIKRDLITEASFELRFDSPYPSEAIFGIVYQIIRDFYPDIKNINLPILQIPEAIRRDDPNLKYQPSNRLQNDSYGFSIGSNVISFFVLKPYIGWSKWKPIITGVLTKLLNVQLFKTIERIGLRYIDFIDGSVFSVANVNIKITGKDLSKEQTTLKTEYLNGNYSEIVQIFNNVNMFVDNKSVVGSLIDTDISSREIIDVQDFCKRKEEILEEVHEKTKTLFFSLLKDEYLNKLEPVYDK